MSTWTLLDSRTVITGGSEFTMPLRVRTKGSGSGPGGAWHAFNDRLQIDVLNRNYDGQFNRYRHFRAGERLPVKIGGVETSPVEAPTERTFGDTQSVGIPVTVPSGTHDVTVDGQTIGQIRVYNPDMPGGSAGEDELATNDPVVDIPDSSSGGSSSGGNGDPAPDPSPPSNSPTPDPTGGSSGQSSTDTTSSGSGIESRARAAAIAVMGVFAALIATR